MGEEVRTSMNKEQFESLVFENIKRDGIVSLMSWLSRSDFYTAPASTRYHGAYEGGLCEHSIDVYRQLVALNKFYCTSCSDESVAIVSLFHDICKVGVYKPDSRNVKDAAGVWHKVPCYKHDEDFPFGGHGSKSVYLIQNFMKLDPHEAVAINCHMGAWDMSSYSNPSRAYEVFPLAWLLHVADEAATYLKREEEEY